MKKNVFFFMIIIFLMVSCYPDGPESYDDMDVVYTNYDDEFNFASQGTYVIPDKIVKITGTLDQGEDPEFVKEPYNTQMLDRIESNLAALGWTKVDDPETADLALFPAVWINTNVYYYYDYWCWYYYYYCGWGYYYPAVTSYTTGTFVMAFVAAGEEYVDPYTVWVGIANGVLSGAYDYGRISKSIDQAFKQSPYLKIK
ncbi:MAG: DUF4136 domain-containing protein [Bacteroidetes bacterium]|nr:DUF4136 domain-containing protein [Bacteroidota bacterium]